MNTELENKLKKDDIKKVQLTNPFLQEEQKPQVQEQQKPQEPQKDLPKTTFDDIKQEYKYQTLTITKSNLAYLKIISKIKHITQTNLINDILTEYFKAQNYDDEIENSVKGYKATL